MTVVTRFAPSPTGFLHIGGARTALFNWLYARHCGGAFKLRIEDTDKARSTEEAKKAILDGLEWLGLKKDGKVVYQSERAHRHIKIAHKLLQTGNAYYCYCSQEELAEMREKARAEGRKRLYDGRWRDRDPSEAPKGIDPVVRLKVPLSGETVIKDAVQGTVRVANEQLDDMIILRADGSPTYMLAVVVDDHQMKISHVIRGDDHLNNAFRQAQIYTAMGWDLPVFAHIPLIHGPDGAKLSKRHGALGVEAYRDMGFLPAALRNYLLRLGWSHGDDEIIGTEQAIEWFDLPGINKAAARFDPDKLASVNAHYLRGASPDELLALIAPRLESDLGQPLDAVAEARLKAGLPGLTERVKTSIELSENAIFYAQKGAPTPDDKARKLLDADGVSRLAALLPDLSAAEPWTEESVESAVRAFAERTETKLGQVAQPLRAALTGRTASPGIFEVMAVLGREETLERLKGLESGVAR